MISSADPIHKPITIKYPAFTNLSSGNDAHFGLAPENFTIAMQKLRRFVKTNNDGHTLLSSQLVRSKLEESVFAHSTELIAGEKMNDSPKKKPRHRLVNEVRLASMKQWFEVAATDTLGICVGDIDPLYKEQVLGIEASIEEVLNLLTECLLSEKTADDYKVPESLIIQWYQEHHDARTPLSEKKPRGDLMQIYKVAAALFNRQLEVSKLMGERLDEKATTASALERALNRARKKSSVE